MQYQMIGQIFKVIPRQMTDKTSGQVVREYCEVTVEKVTIDANGFRVKSVDKVNFGWDDYQELKSSIDKHIAVPLEFRQWCDKNTGQMTVIMMMSDNATYRIFDKDPFAADDKQTTVSAKCKISGIRAFLPSPQFCFAYKV